MGQVRVRLVMQGWGGVGGIECELFPIHIQTFMNDSNSRNNNLYGFYNS